MQDEQKPVENSHDTADMNASEDSASEDQQAEEAVVAGVEAVGKVALFFRKITSFLSMIWKTPKYRWSTIGGLIVVVGILLGIPATRWAMLNTVGFRANAQVTVFDQASELPLKNVEVAIGDVMSWTDNDGRVYLEDVRLGENQLKINKDAYADIIQTVDIGFGSNDFLQQTLAPIGTSFDFTITNWLSGEPIERAVVEYQSSSVFSDEEGVAILTIPPTDSESLDITIYSEGFIETVVTIDSTSMQMHPVELIASQKNFYITRASGNYDIYSSNLDGTDPTLVVQGTGNEAQDTRFSVSPNNSHAALVSTRSLIEQTHIDYEYDYILKELHVVDLNSSELIPVTSSERIELVGWVRDHLIFVEVSAGASRHNPERTRLKTYNTVTRQTNEIISSNYFQDVRLVGERIFYAPGLSDKQTEPQEYLYSVNYLGDDTQTILEKSTNGILQSDSNTLSLSTYDAKEQESEYFNYDLRTGQISDRSRQANDNYYYQTSASGQNTATVAVRDGKGVLLVTEGESDQRTIVSKVGAKLPLRWIGEHMIVFRVSDSQGTADFVVDIRGGDPQKISDVTDVAGSDLWYYYRGGF